MKLELNEKINKNNTHLLREGDVLLCEFWDGTIFTPGSLYTVSGVHGDIILSKENGCSFVFNESASFTYFGRENPHPKFDVILAWARGLRIEFTPRAKDAWMDWDFDHSVTPNFGVGEFRIKQNPKPHWYWLTKIEETDEYFVTSNRYPSKEVAEKQIAEKERSMRDYVVIDKIESSKKFL